MRYFVKGGMVNLMRVPWFHILSGVIKPVTYRLEEARSLLLGAIARIDMIAGRPFFFSSFVSTAVSIHITDTEKVCNIGTSTLFKVPHNPFQNHTQTSSKSHVNIFKVTHHSTLLYIDSI